MWARPLCMFWGPFFRPVSCLFKNPSFISHFTLIHLYIKTFSVAAPSSLPQAEMKHLPHIWHKFQVFGLKEGGIWTRLFWYNWSHSKCKTTWWSSLIQSPYCFRRFLVDLLLGILYILLSSLMSLLMNILQTTALPIFEPSDFKAFLSFQAV